MNQRGFIQLSIMAWAAIGAAVAIGGLSLALWVHTNRLESVKREYAAFVATVKAQGEEQLRRNKETIARDLKAKERIDAENRRLRSNLATRDLQLRQSRADAGYVPAASPGSASPDRAAFDRSELDGAIRQLDASVSGLIAEGDQARIDLDTARRWAQERE